MVRRLDAERAGSRGRQENDGLRVVGAVWRKTSACHFLPDGRRRGADRDVQGVRRTAADGADRRGAAAHGGGAGGRLCAHREGVGSATELGAILYKRGHEWFQTWCAVGARSSIGSQNTAPEVGLCGVEYGLVS